MFGRRVFSDMRRAGMGVGVSKAKLSKAMLGVLLQIPTGSANLKETKTTKGIQTGQGLTNKDNKRFKQMAQSSGACKSVLSFSCSTVLRRCCLILPLV